jgi:hypothetical protein
MEVDVSMNRNERSLGRPLSIRASRHSNYWDLDLVTPTNPNTHMLRCI